MLGWGQRRETITAETEAIHRLEIQAGRFAFQARLPATVDAEAAKATLHAGILEVRLPKRPTHLERLEQAQLPEEVRKEAERELERLAHMPPGAAEYVVASTYLDWILNLPWQLGTEDNLDIGHARQVWAWPQVWLGHRPAGMSSSSKRRSSPARPG